MLTTVACRRNDEAVVHGEYSSAGTAAARFGAAVLEIGQPPANYDNPPIEWESLLRSVIPLLEPLLAG